MTKTEAARKSKSILITGCSSGFGHNMLDVFLKDGWRVFATTRQAEALQIVSENSRLHILPYDIAIQTDRQAVVDSILEACPAGLDCLVNNAGYGLAGPLAALSEAKIRQQFEVNFFAPLLLTRDLLPSLHLAKGTVINISSVLGFTGTPMQSLYAASKFALEGLSESLYYELAPHGVKVSLVEPGGFRTGFSKGMDKAETIPEKAFHFQRHFEGYQSFLKQVSTKGKGNDPVKVAQVVLKLANHDSPPLRVRVGNDAQALYYLRRALPQKLADKVFKRISLNILETI